MKANEFVEKLKSIAPSLESTIARGYSEDGAKRILRSYEADYKDNKLYQNELLNLVKNYDSSNIEIGFIRFDLENQNDISLETDQFFRVGWVEGYLLVVNKQTGEVQMEDFSSEGFIIANCAENSEKFLDAVFEFAKPHGNFFDEQNQYQRDSKIILCATLAGGNQYQEFYILLLS